MKKKRILLGLGAFALAGLATTALTSCKDNEKMYTVTFYDGETEISTTSVKTGYNVEVPTTPTSDGKIFNGWYSDAELTTQFDFGSLITGDTSIYARWINECTVTFKDGSKTLSTATVTPGYNVEVPTAPTKDGYTFNGWYSDAALTTQFDFGSIITADTTIYARWEAVYHAVNLYIEEGVLYQTIAVQEGDVLPSDLAPTKNYRKFNGKWYTDADLTELFNASTSIEEEIDLYAGWDVETESVMDGCGNKDGLTSWSVVRSAAGVSGTTAFAAGDYTFGALTIVANGKTRIDTKNGSDCVNTQGCNLEFALSGEGTSNEIHGDGLFASSTAKTAVFLYKVADDGTETLLKETEVYSGSGTAVKYDWTELEAGNYVVKCSASVQYYNIYSVSLKEKAAPESISVVSTNTNFLVGSTFDNTGIACTLKYANNATETVLAATTAGDATTGYVLDYSAVDFSKEGTYTVKVSYTATDKYGSYPLETSYEVNVIAIDSITAYTYGINQSNSRATEYNQLVYAVNGTLDTSKVYVHATGTIGDTVYTEILEDGYTFSEVDLTTAGRKTVTVTFGGVTTTFDVEVVEKLFDEEDTYAKVYVDASVDAATRVNENTDDSYTVSSTGSTYVFKSITEALQYFELCGVADDAGKEIVLQDGTYNEKVYVDMPYVYIHGIATNTSVNGSSSGAVITFNAMNGLTAPNGGTYSTDGAASFTISKNATDCLIENVKLMNYYNTNELYNKSKEITSGTQATAVLVRGDRTEFNNVTFSGYHDTLYADLGRQYYNNCYIEGRTDYIFGSTATAYFTDCTIKTIGAGLTEKNGGYVIATKGQSGQTYGYIFDGCTFTADDATQEGCVSIARGWDQYMTIMIMNSTIDNHFSKGTYGQTYQEKTFTAETFAAYLAQGIYTLDGTTYTKVAEDAEFNAETQYYVILNDRYTKMNAAPTASLLFEYNNTGDGAIAYSEEAAAKYAEATFTLLDPSDSATQAKVAKYADLAEIFSTTNGTVSYSVNWIPASQASYATISVYEKASDSSALVTWNDIHAYKGSTLVASQISALKKAVSEVVEEGYTLVGLYVDSTYSNELDTTTVLESDTKIYARIIMGTLEVKELTAYNGAAYDGEAETTTTDWAIYSGTTLVKDAKAKYISLTPGTDVAKETAEGYVASDTIDSGNYLKSPVIDSSLAIKEIKLVIYGGTAETGNSQDFEITAYDADGTSLKTIHVYSPADKKSGYFITDASGDTTKSETIVLSADSAISYYTIKNTGKKASGSDNAKGYGITFVKATYEVITVGETTTKTVTDTHTLTYSEISTDNLTATGVYYKVTGSSKNIEYAGANNFTSLPDDATYVTPEETVDKYDQASIPQAALTGNNAFLTISTGTVQYRDAVKYYKSATASSGNPGCIEIKNDALKVTFTGTGTIKLTAASTGGSNKSSIGVKDSEGNYIAATYDTTNTNIEETTTSNLYSVKGTTAVEFTFTISAAGEYTICSDASLDGYGRNTRITSLVVSDTYTKTVPVTSSSITTSTSNASLKFADTSTVDSTVFDISGATINSATNTDKDYASAKVIGTVTAAVKKGAVVYVSAYYNQSSSAVSYTITANGKTTDVLNTNTYIVAQEDQTVTITGSGNNYLQAIYVIYPEDEATTFTTDLTASNATFSAATTLQYSVYLYNGMLFDTVTGKLTAREGNAWGQFNSTTKAIVVLQKGQTVAATTYNGDATMTYSVLGGEATSVTNAGAQQATTFTATADFTVVEITAATNDYITSIVVTE